MCFNLWGFGVWRGLHGALAHSGYHKDAHPKPCSACLSIELILSTFFLEKFMPAWALATNVWPILLPSPGQARWRESPLATLWIPKLATHRPNIDQKSTTNQSTINPKSIRNQSTIDLGGVLGPTTVFLCPFVGSWVRFVDHKRPTWPQLGPQD